MKPQGEALVQSLRSGSNPTGSVQLLPAAAGHGAAFRVVLPN